MSSAVELPGPVEKEGRPKREGRRKTGTAEVFVEVPLVVDPQKEKGIKRKQPDDATEAAPLTSSSTIPGDTIRYRPCSRPRPSQIITSPTPSPTYGFDVIDSLNTSPLFLGSSLPSSSLVSPSSLTLEVAILRSQLDAANDNLRRERELSQRERERSQQELRERRKNNLVANVRCIRSISSRSSRVANEPPLFLAMIKMYIA